jgi:hypothetical protein
MDNPVNSNEQKAPTKEKKPKKQKQQFDPSKFPLPDYVEHRIKIWEEVKKINESKNKGTYFLTPIFCFLLL